MFVAPSGDLMAEPVNVETLVISSRVFRPSVTGDLFRDPSAAEKTEGGQEFSLVNAKPFTQSKPKAFPRSPAAPAKGMWSAIKSNLPPFFTHFSISLISSLEKAEGVGRAQLFVLEVCNGFAITNILQFFKTPAPETASVNLLT